jgi:hypothetical protein
VLTLLSAKSSILDIFIRDSLEAQPWPVAFPVKRRNHVEMHGSDAEPLGGALFSGDRTAAGWTPAARAERRRDRFQAGHLETLRSAEIAGLDNRD